MDQIIEEINNPSKMLTDLDKNIMNNIHNEIKIPKVYRYLTTYGPCNGYCLDKFKYHPKSCINNLCYRSPVYTALSTNFRIYKKIYEISCLLNITEFMDFFSQIDCCCKNIEKYQEYYPITFFNFEQVYLFLTSTPVFNAIKEELNYKPSQYPLYNIPDTDCLHRLIAKPNQRNFASTNKKILLDVFETYKENCKICIDLLNQQIYEIIIYNIDKKSSFTEIKNKIIINYFKSDILNINFSNLTQATLYEYCLINFNFGPLINVFNTHPKITENIVFREKTKIKEVIKKICENKCWDNLTQLIQKNTYIDIEDILLELEIENPVKYLVQFDSLCVFKKKKDNLVKMLNMNTKIPEIFNKIDMTQYFHELSGTEIIEIFRLVIKTNNINVLRILYNYIINNTGNNMGVIDVIDIEVKTWVKFHLPFELVKDSSNNNEILDFLLCTLKITSFNILDFDNKSLAYYILENREGLFEKLSENTFVIENNKIMEDLIKNKIKTNPRIILGCVNNINYSFLDNFKSYSNFNDILTLYCDKVFNNKIYWKNIFIDDDNNLLVFLQKNNLDFLIEYLKSHVETRIILDFIEKFKHPYIKKIHETKNTIYLEKLEFLLLQMIIKENKLDNTYYKDFIYDIISDIEKENYFKKTFYSMFYLTCILLLTLIIIRKVDKLIETLTEKFSNNNII